MQNLILDGICLMLFLPLWIFLIIMGARFFAVYLNKKLIYLLTLFASLLGIGITSLGLMNLVNLPAENYWAFLNLGNFSLSCGILVDKLSLIVALLLFIVSFLVQWFSIIYMKNEKKNYRFFAFLNLFNFAMAGLIFSPNLFQLYFFWEIVAVISYLLIGFDYKYETKSVASKRVFLINRFGDTCFIAGILISSMLIYNYSNNFSFVTLPFIDMNAISTLILAYTSTPMFCCICLLFIIAAAVKSAQLPFYTWLQDAMEAKLPVSALLHSATMVVAGAFLLIRLEPLFSLDVNIMNVIAYLGIFTALICSSLASIETHPKKVLAYSTSANLGLIFLAIGVMNVKAGIIFLVAHGLIKSLLFLSLDKIENYINYVTFLLGGLSLSGLIFSGVIAKECLFVSLEGNQLLSILYCIVAFLTAFYIIRIAIVMIKGKSLINKIDILKYAPIGMLFIANILFYFIIRGKVEYKIAEPFWLAIVGWVVVYILYTKNLLMKYVETPKLLEKLYNNTCVNIYSRIANLSRDFDDNVFANYKPILCSAKFSVKTIAWIEKNLMDGVVNLVINVNRKCSEVGVKLQTRNIQSYNAYAFILLTIILTLVIFAYKIILNEMS